MFWIWLRFVRVLEFTLEIQIPKLEYLPDGYIFEDGVTVFASGKDGIWTVKNRDGVGDVLFSPGNVTFNRR